LKKYQESPFALFSTKTVDPFCHLCYANKRFSFHFILFLKKSFIHSERIFSPIGAKLKEFGT